MEYAVYIAIITFLDRSSFLFTERPSLQLSCTFLSVQPSHATNKISSNLNEWQRRKPNQIFSNESFEMNIPVWDFHK